MSALSRFVLAALTAGCVGLSSPAGGEPLAQAEAPTSSAAPSLTDYDAQTLRGARNAIREGRSIFRHDTFGSEKYWGGTLRLHEAIAGAALGGPKDVLRAAPA